MKAISFVANLIRACVRNLDLRVQYIWALSKSVGANLMSQDLRVRAPTAPLLTHFLLFTSFMNAGLLKGGLSQYPDYFL